MFKYVFEWGWGGKEGVGKEPSTNKTDCCDITEILLKVALNTITPYQVSNGKHQTRLRQPPSHLILLMSIVTSHLILLVSIVTSKL